MTRKADGELELVLGNKQLLSLFFLVVVLFGVFFSLGYMVGKSVGPAQTRAGPATGPPVAVKPSPSPSPLPASAAAGAPAEKAEPPRVVVEQTQPARSEPAQENGARDAAKPEETPAAPPAPEPSPALVSQQLHLQIAAIRVRDDAEALAESLRQKGYQVLLNSQTRDGWHRVLLGPFPSERAAQEMKAQLEKDGFKSILKKP